MKQHSFLPAPVLALTALGFTLGTCEFIIVGILPDIADGMGVSLSAVGRLVSVFAGCYALGTPVISAATGRVPRFQQLVILLASFAAVNLLSMLAPYVGILYFSRMLAALVSGPLTAVAMLYARDTAPEGHTARAIAMVYTGFSIASVVGVPIGTFTCHLLGWRASFALILVMTALLTPPLLRLLPRTSPLPEAAAGGFLRQFTVLRDPRMSLCVGAIVLSGCSTYSVYTYLTPILTDTLGLAQETVSPLLMGVGLCCLASNLLSGWLGEHGGIRRLPAVFTLQVLLFALMPLLVRRTLPGLAAMGLMAVCMYILNTPCQMHILNLAETDYPFASSLCASMLSVAYNLGIAVGSFTGSTVQAGWGLSALGVPAALYALAALGLNLALLRRLRRQPQTL